MTKMNPMAFISTVLVTAIIVGGGVYYWQSQGSTSVTLIEESEGIESETDMSSTELVELNQTEFGSLLYEKEYYDLPFGAAEIEGYYTKVERATSLDDSTPRETCSAFVVMDGPELLLDALDGEQYGNPPTVVIGSEDSYWGGINASTEEDPVKILVTLNPLFEGELIGCMSWPFDSIVEIE